MGREPSTDVDIRVCRRFDTGGRIFYRKNLITESMIRYGTVFDSIDRSDIRFFLLDLFEFLACYLTFGAGA